MKSKLILLTFLLIFIVEANAQITIPEKKVLDQPNAAAHITKVINALVSCDSVTHLRNQPGSFYYCKATIKSIGTGSVNYRWLIFPPGAPSPLIITGSITLSGTGTDYIYMETCWGCTGSKNPFPHNPVVHYTIGFQIESPNKIYGNYIGPV